MNDDNDKEPIVSHLRLKVNQNRFKYNKRKYQYCLRYHKKMLKILL